MKKLIIIIVAVAVLAVSGIIFVPRLAHTCDDCGEFFIGTGYDANVISDLFSTEEQIICKKCAEKQHMISTKVGKTLDEYKRPLF